MSEIEFPWEEPPDPPEMERKYRKLERKDWDSYFMGLLKEIKKQSSCLKKAVSAILVKDGRIIASGYNGLPKGIPHCERCVRLDEDLKNYSLCQVVHAEINTIILCAKFGVSTEGATLYVEYFPCAHCTGALINAGIKEIVYEKPPVDKIAIPMAGYVGIKRRKWKHGS